LYVKQIILFALDNIPQADENTLKNFLQLVNATGSFNSLSHKEILHRMDIVLKYVPDTCPHSFAILVELLDIPLSSSEKLVYYPQTKPIFHMPVDYHHNSLALVQ